MTTPRIETFRRGGARWYRDPLTGNEFIGVTSITGLTPKPWLAPWQAKLTAEFAVENIGSIVQMTLDAQKAANVEKANQAVIDHVKGAPRRYTTAAADTGSEVHSLCEAIAKGEDPGRIHPDLQGYIDGFNRFLDEYQPEFLWAEQTVFSEEHGYAGTADALMKIDGQLILGDYKAGRQVYPEASLQCALYSHAQFSLDLIDPEPSLTTISEPTIRRVPLPKIEGAMVIHLRPDSTKVVPLDIGEEVFETALALKHVHAWEASISKRVLGTPIDV